MWLWKLWVWGHTIRPHEGPLKFSKNDGWDLSIGTFCSSLFGPHRYHSATLKEHTLHVRKILGIIFRYALKLKIKKCCFSRRRLALPGFIIKKEGMRMYLGKVWRLCIRMYLNKRQKFVVFSDLRVVTDDSLKDLRTYISAYMQLLLSKRNSRGWWRWKVLLYTWKPP